jgi:hypothetical protein
LNYLEEVSGMPCFKPNREMLIEKGPAGSFFHQREPEAETSMPRKSLENKGFLIQKPIQKMSESRV